MLSRIAIAVPMFLAAQAGLTYWAAGGERIPAHPRFSQIPQQLGQWQRTGDDPISPETIQQLGADATVSQVYLRQNSASGAIPVRNTGLESYGPSGAQDSRQPWNGSLFVAWFQSQRGGASQPHSPQVCLPAAGWVPTVSDRIAMDTASGAVQVNRYVANLGPEKVVVLYWYQTRARVIASEWAAKFWVVVDRLKEKRTDTSLVRIVVWNNGRSDDATTSAALTLAQQAYPVLTRLFSN